MAYVDTEKLKRNIRVNLMPNVDIDGTVTVENAERFFLDLIEKTSTSDVEEVKHGEWAWIADDSPMCTCCGKVFDTTDDADAGITWLYCPKCGAKMDGGKAE